MARVIIPIAVENTIQTFGGIISMAIIGRLDVSSISIVAMSGIVLKIIWAFFRGISIGGIVHISRAHAEGNNKKLIEAVQQTAITSIVLAVTISLLFFLYAEGVLGIFDLENELLLKTAEYLRIAVFGIPFFVVITVFCGAYQGVGNAAVSTYLNLIMTIIFIGLEYIFIYGMSGSILSGVKGVAVAQVISQVFVSVLLLLIISNDQDIFAKCLELKKFKLNMNKVKEIYEIGIPTSIETIFWQIAIIIVTNVVRTYGETAYAAYQLGITIEAVSYMPAMGFSMAATTCICEAFAAKNKKLAKLYLIKIIKGVMLVTTVISVFFMFFPENILLLLTNKKEVINIAATYLFIMSFIEIPLNMIGVFSGVMRGSGYSKFPAAVSVIGLWVIRIPLIILSTYYFKFSITGCWLVICIDIIVRFILTAVIFQRRIWKLFND